MKDWFGIAVALILGAFVLHYAWAKHQANVTAAQSDQGYLANEGLINNPYQDVSLASTGQATVDPLTGEIIIQSSSINAMLNQQTTIASQTSPASGLQSVT